MWLAFVTFVSVNDGVVVGDRSAHRVVFHPAQILYFLAFAVAWDWLRALEAVPGFISWTRQEEGNF